jgi:RNA polymerase sigma-70 factor
MSAPDETPHDPHSSGHSARLSEAHWGARQRWPSFELTLEQFSNHIGRLGNLQLGEVDSTALYLTAACALRIDAACTCLERSYFPRLRAAVARLGTWHFVDEVVQKTRERLLVGPEPRIGTYRGEGSLGSWLQSTAGRIAVDLRRRDRALHSYIHFDANPEMSLDGWERDSEPELGSTSKTNLASAAQRALSAAVAALDPADRQLLFLFYLQAVSADQLAACLRVDRSTIYRRIKSLTGRIKRQSCKAIQVGTGIAADEICRAVRNTVDDLDLVLAPWQSIPSLPFPAARAEAVRVADVP